MLTWSYDTQQKGTYHNDIQQMDLNCTTQQNIFVIKNATFLVFLIYVVMLGVIMLSDAILSFVMLSIITLIFVILYSMLSGITTLSVNPE